MQNSILCLLESGYKAQIDEQLQKSVLSPNLNCDAEGPSETQRMDDSKNDKKWQMIGKIA